MTGPRHFSPFDEPLWKSIEGRRLSLQSCDSCGYVRYPPGPICPRCLGLGFTWQPVQGKGQVLSWTTFHRQYLPAWPAPHTVVAVQLAEGPIVVGYVKAEDAARVAIDSDVELDYEPHPDGYIISFFRMTAAVVPPRAG